MQLRINHRQSHVEKFAKFRGCFFVTHNLSGIAVQEGRPKRKICLANSVPLVAQNE